VLQLCTNCTTDHAEGLLTMPLVRRVEWVLCILLLGGTSCVRTQPSPTSTASRPNIVHIFPDNLGWGEVGVHGSVRGAPTPRLDRMAAEGIRLNNFNVEFSCTVKTVAEPTGEGCHSERSEESSGSR
jgi:hypothetical protein